MADYKVENKDHAALLSALFNSARVNGYCADGSVCPDNLRQADLSEAQAARILGNPEDSGPLVAARREGSSVHIESINGRWLDLTFSAGHLRAEHQVIGGSGNKIQGAEQYSENFGVSIQEVADRIGRLRDVNAA